MNSSKIADNKDEVCMLYFIVNITHLPLLLTRKVLYKIYTEQMKLSMLGLV